MNGRYDLVIIGMGSAGVVAAEFAAAAGVRTVAVERSRIGGDCLWTGCVPSKALIASARLAQQMRRADQLGLPVLSSAIDTAAVWARLRGVRERISEFDDNPDRFRSLGIEVLLGQPGRLLGPHAVLVGERRLETRFVLLCTGSRPQVPPVPGLAEAGFLTTETLFELERAPASMAILGAGPTGIELGQAMQRLGTQCHLFEQTPQLLATEEPWLAARLLETLRAEGVGIHAGVRVERVTREGSDKVVHATVGGAARTWRVEEVLVTAGRLPNSDGLGLDELGIRPPGTGSPRAGLATNLKSVYAVGDLAGRHNFTHSAGHEAAQAVREMFYPGRGRPPRLVPSCIFSDPELARVGLTSAAARAALRRVEVWESDFTHSDRARTDAVTGGLTLVTARGRLVGAHVLAPPAGEMIHELALAVQHRLRLSDLASLVHVYPTLASSVGLLAARNSLARARRYRWVTRRPGRFAG